MPWTLAIAEVFLQWPSQNITCVVLVSLVGVWPVPSGFCTVCSSRLYVDVLSYYLRCLKFDFDFCHIFVICTVVDSEDCSAVHAKLGTVGA